MKHGIFSVRDSATKTYNVTFTAPTNAAAMRQFGDLAKDENTNVYKHPTDFVLYRVASWDDDSGEMTPETLQKLAHAEDYHGEAST